MSVHISGLGLVGGFGCGKEDLLKALAGEAVVPQPAALRDGDIPVYRADSGPLENYLNKRALRRIDQFSRLALLGAFQALADAEQPDLDRSRLGVVLGSGFGALTTTFGFLDSVLNDGDVFASPTAFSNSVHNAAAAHIAMQLKISGPTLTVSQFDMTPVSALVTALQWLADQRVDAVLLGLVDGYCPVLGYCWQRFAAGADQGGMTPFDFSRSSAVPGEGAAFFLLQSEKIKRSYATVERAVMGCLRPSEQLTLPSGTPLVLACDGLAEFGRGYREQLDESSLVGCYTPLYGASPIGQGFDLAVAALAAERGRHFASRASGDDCPGRRLGEEDVDRQTVCLRLGIAGEYGLIELGRDEACSPG